MAKEIDPDLLKFIHASDQSEEAVDLMVKNFELNQLDSSKVKGKQRILTNVHLILTKHTKKMLTMSCSILD